MRLWNKLNDKFWPLVEKLGLGNTFDKYYIPPVLLPLLAIFVILLLIFAFSGGPSDSNLREIFCGDGICDPLIGENTEVCPTDCPDEEPEVKRVQVLFDKPPPCRLTVKLYDSSSKLLNSQRAMKPEFIFDSIDSDTVYVTIEGPYGENQTSSTETLQEEETQISIILSSQICEEPQPETGALRISINDVKTNQVLNGVKVSIGEILNGNIVNLVVDNVIVNGQQEFPLPGGKSYAIYAEKAGYDTYDGTAQQTTIMEGVTSSKAIYLTSSAPETGELEVCIVSGTTTLSSGIITLESLSGDFILYGDVTESPPATEPSDTGCYVFTDIPSGKVLSVSVSSPPEGCVPSSTESVNVEAGRRKMISMSLDCQPLNAGYLKVKVLSPADEVLTEDSTITLWTENDQFISGRGRAGSLAMGDDGYTEEVTVPSDEQVYVWIKGMPLGYLDYESALIGIEAGEHREVEIVLDYSDVEIPSTNFTFIGVTAPNSVAKSQPFSVIVSKIFYENLELTSGFSKLEVSVGGIECDEAYDGSWNASCVAPDVIGKYTLEIKAKYKGKTETYTLPLDVREYRTGDGSLTVHPVFVTYGDPPLILHYNIMLNDVKVTNIAEQKLDLTYVDSPNAYPGELSPLTLSRDYWTIEADVPYMGEYQLDMYVAVESGGVYYDASYTLTFHSLSHSEQLEVETRVSDNILLPSASFRTEAILTFQGIPVYGLENFEAYLDQVFHTLIWNNALQMYYVSIAAPFTETCNEKILFLINDIGLDAQETINVIDTYKTKTPRCPLDYDDSCDSIEDVRKCIENQKSRLSHYSNLQLSGCIQSGCSSRPMSSCPAQNKGDLDLNCELTDVDINLFSNYLGVVGTASERNELADCLDMDNDGDVDNDDLKCLRHLVSGKWYGDIKGTEAACVDNTLKGGFCYDVDTDSPVPGDTYYDSKIDVNDEQIMQYMITDVSAGVTPHEEILDSADFNQDGTIDNTDLECLRAFFTMDFETGNIVPSLNTLHTECMNIFGLFCRGRKGDLNDNGVIDVTDLFIVRLIATDLLEVPNTTLACADIDSDDQVTKYDVACMEYYLNNEEDRWLVCLKCNESLPTEAQYAYEICNDGYDNDCDGLTDDEDSDCTCNSETSCNSRLDIDGGTTLGIDDDEYKVCLKKDSGTTYEWITKEALDDLCDESTEWQSTYVCDDTTFSCVFKYPASFTGGGTADDGSFGWLEGTGNIGPLHVKYDCGGSAPACATGWNSVLSKEGDCCDDCHWYDFSAEDEDRCSWCRFKYDYCQDVSCGSSGSGAASATCTSTTPASYTESCEKKITCMGAYGS